MSIIAILFLIGMTFPWLIDFGALKLTVGRLILVLTIIPSLFMWLSGRAGRVRVPDLLLIGFSLWSFACFTAVDGIGQAVNSGGLTFIETFGAYLLGRICVRNERQFYQAILTLFLIVLFFIPFALYEAVTLKNALLEMFASVMPSNRDIFMRPRWGLRRAQTVFNHPILFGVFCSNIVGCVHLVLGRTLSPALRWLLSGLAVFGAFLSLSSGPFSALAAQIALLLWNWTLRKFALRWWLLAGMFASMYLAISLLSNQSFFEFYVHYFAFSQDTGWDRIRIWHYGWLSTFNHPIFGIGDHDYERPEWMEASIDMYWLISFVRFGFIGGILMFTSFCWVFASVAFKKGLNDKQNAYRTGYLVSMIGVFTVGWSVHFWNTVYLMLMFLLGSALWMLDVNEPAGKSSDRTGSDRSTPGSTGRNRAPAKGVSDVV